MIANLYLIKEKDSHKVVGILNAFDDAAAEEYCTKYSHPIYVQSEHGEFVWTNSLVFEPVRRLRDDRSPYSHDEQCRRDEITEQTKREEEEYYQWCQETDYEMFNNAINEGYECDDQRC